MSAYPLLRYKDAEAALEFLQAAFGFEAREVHRDDKGRIAHAEVHAGDGLLMLGEDASGDAKYADHLAHGWVYVALPEVDSLYERARAAGAEITMELTDQDYGSRDFGAKDPEGNQFAFGTYEPA